MTASNSKLVTVRKIVLLSMGLLLLIPTIFCGRALIGLRPALGRDRFPDADIVYARDSALGFINADGSRVATFPFMLAHFNLVGRWGRPLATGDPNTLIVTSAIAPGYSGRIFAIHAGKATVECGWSGVAQVANDQQHILVGSFQPVEEYSLSDCGTSNPPEKIYSDISGTLSPDEQYSAEIRQRADDHHPIIYIHRLETGEERMIGEGEFPVWSPDGEWLAYTGIDGIYLIQNSPNAQSRLLVLMGSPDPSVGVLVYQYRDYYQYYPPIASWSPDGQWLVYHMYNSKPVNASAGDWAKYYSIFRVNVNTGKTIKLLDGGYSPFWRWPVQEP